MFEIFYSNYVFKNKLNWTLQLQTEEYSSFLNYLFYGIFVVFWALSK